VGGLGQGKTVGPFEAEGEYSVVTSGRNTAVRGIEGNRRGKGDRGYVEPSCPRIERRANPARSSPDTRENDRGLIQGWRSEDRPIAIRFQDLQRLPAEGRCKINQIISREPLPVIGCRSGRKGLRRGGGFAGNIRGRNASLLNRPDGSSRLTVQNVAEALFA